MLTDLWNFLDLHPDLETKDMHVAIWSKEVISLNKDLI